MKAIRLVPMIGYEWKLLMRSKWLVSSIGLFLLMALLFYGYGMKSITMDPTVVTYGLDGVSSDIDTGTVDPSLFGLEEMETEEESEGNGKAGFSRSIALLMNVCLWIVPIITLVIGVSSVTADKESGRMSLLRTYRVSGFYYLVSKYVALFLALSIATSLSYGVFGAGLALMGKLHGVQLFITFLTLNLVLIAVFGALAVLLVIWSASRMQGLSFALAAWSFFVFVYEFIVFSIIGLIPCTYKLPNLIALIFLNPVESLRVWAIDQLNAAYVFGPQFLIIEQWGDSKMLTVYLLGSTIGIITITLTGAILKLKWRWQ
ncbi:ABC-type transport system involved in multi-copper enzyme maturation, permease component [Thalassobacillus cyri]|uniref:ABC-type transport system involved in multi-copper enzyme maturation, permease component n=1 Tax=Thalassobacillus cyri TaxID=571932 RepID=A0A1H4AZD6_9BACI|nr:ABC transporter permease subunit [Thalassobacillus cyri]SEA41157.1 ABC-type transport system involved in multi-copper enzyme maturation, permease component [Thalassobacillus cyri]